MYKKGFNLWIRALTKKESLWLIIAGGFLGYMFIIMDLTFR